MTRTLTAEPDEIAPQWEAVFEYQGIPARETTRAQFAELYETACDLLAEFFEPRGVLAEITQAEFAGVYEGDGENDSDTPVGDIHPRADHLALFAVTLGEPVCARIRACFDANDFALGAMLDSAASVATDNLADTIESRYRAILAESGRLAPNAGVLRYSPGYCGWHISGQRRLFERLEPERIGISLGESFLMQPLKSVSGVLIAGPKEIHRFPMKYICCPPCETHSCRDRFRSLTAVRGTIE